MGKSRRRVLWSVHATMKRNRTPLRTPRRGRAVRLARSTVLAAATCGLCNPCALASPDTITLATTASEPASTKTAPTTKPASTTRASTGPLFALPGDRLTVAYVCAPGATPSIKSDLDDSPMLLQMRGLLAAIDQRGVTRLSQCQTTKGPPLERLGEMEAIFDLVLIGEQTNRRVRFEQSADGFVIARLVEAEPHDTANNPDDHHVGAKSAPPRVLRIDPVKLREAADQQVGGGGGVGGWSWPVCIEVPSPIAPLSAGVERVLDKGLAAGRFDVTKDLIADRLTGGVASQLPRAERVLSNERMFVRLPKGHHPRNAWGLLVWIDAGPEGVIPDQLDKALDDTGLICISPANIGNDRPLADRVQLALDAVATAQRHHRIDANRVYIAGISGGGRVASMMLAGFPDIFSGCLGVVGLNNYQRVPTTRGGFYQPGFGKPRGKLWDLYRTHRIAAMTGTRDFNYQEILTSVQMLQGEHLNAKVFEHGLMGHQMGEPEWMTEAIRWIDEPARTRRERDVAAAGELVDSIKRQLKPLARPNVAQRRELIKATKFAPWSEPAWEAARLLGVEASAPSE